jgi:hypothetical protein
VTIGAFRRLADLVHNVGAYGPTALERTLKPEFSMESSREITTDDLERMNPGLFAEN